MARCRCSSSDLLVVNPAVESRFLALEAENALQAQQISLLQVQLYTLEVTTPQGVLVRKIKAATESGFRAQEFAISTLDFTVPNRATNGTHVIHYGIRVLQTVSPAPRLDTVISISVRVGSVTGALVDSHLYPWPLSTAYGNSLVGAFTPSGLVPGGHYVLCTNTDGVGNYQVVQGSWVSLTEIGWAG